MSKLLSRSKHEEFESNSALKRRKYKEIGAPAKLVPAALCTAPALFLLLPVPAFYTMPCLHLFLVFFFSYFNPCNSFYFGLFCNFVWL